MGKAKNFVFEICQQKSKARCMYLAFKHLKISNKKVKSVQKGKTKVQIMFLEVKTQKEIFYWCTYKLNSNIQKK